MVTAIELNEFSSIINACRTLVEKVDVKTGISFKYLTSVLYGKTLLTMCEISTLLQAGYPEGAMALARNTYETLIIFTYLYKNKVDLNLIERFYDDYRVKTCKDHAKYLEWYQANGKGNKYTNKKLHKLNLEYKHLLEKYNEFTSEINNVKYFKQYWWAGKNMSFNKLRKITNYPDSYLYNLSCYRVHAGMTGILNFDNSEEGLLIGACDGGKEIPLHFSLLNFMVITRLYFDIQCVDCLAIITRMEYLLERVFNEIE